MKKNKCTLCGEEKDSNIFFSPQIKHKNKPVEICIDCLELCKKVTKSLNKFRNDLPTYTGL